MHPVSYVVRLESFEGPLDLLLHLIKKSEVDIYDIPVSIITDQYLDYLKMMREINLEVAGDYLVIAAELGLIKSKMLLPKSELGTTEDENDPREELVRKLIEYQRYKEVANEMTALEILGRDVFLAAPSDEERPGELSELLQTDLWSLIDALRGIYGRRGNSLPDYIEFVLEVSTLDDKIDSVLFLLQSHKSVLFQDLFSNDSHRLDVIMMFLAVLELVRNAVIRAEQISPYSPIRLVYSGEGEGWNTVT